MNGPLHGPDCALVDTWLDDWAAGRAPDDLARRIDAHIALCDRCRRLLATVIDDGPQPGGAGEDPDLLPDVLGRTTGSPCAQAEELLPALVDDHLDADSRDILRGHVSHCEACARLLTVLQEAQLALPALAEIPPPLGFAERVLAATSAAPRRGSVAAWWLRLLARPRASLELAYIGTVLIVVLLGNPVAAFHGAREEAGRLASAVPVARLAGELPVKDAAIGTVARLLDGLTSAASAVATEISTKWRQARALVDGIEGAVGEAINWIAHLDLKRVIRGAEQSLRPPPRPSADGQRKH
jgi:anti-sigma factor RsiW